MLTSSVLLRALGVACLLLPVFAILDSTAPSIQATAAFPETNPFHHVVNGERNTINVQVENQSDQNVTIATIAGSMHNAETGAVIKNLTALTYNMPLMEKAKVTVPYSFYSEFKAGDLQLKIWVNYAGATDKHRVDAYESIVTVVEPPASWLDFKMITTYLIVAGALGGVGYLAVQNFWPGGRGKRGGAKKIRTKTAVVDTPVDAPPVPGSGTYSEEWIPEHHLRSRKKKAEGALSSGDERSGNDSAAEKRRGRKK